jgi:hypothetical protein
VRRLRQRSFNRLQYAKKRHDSRTDTRTHHRAIFKAAVSDCLSDDPTPPKNRTVQQEPDEFQALTGSVRALVEAEMTNIELKRDKRLKDAIRAYQVELDGAVIGKVSNGESVRFEVRPGRHRLRLTIDWCGSEYLEFEIQEGQTLRFECGNNVPALLDLIYITFLRNKYLWLKAI